MDFSSQLANLQRKADNAAASRGAEPSGGGGDAGELHHRYGQNRQHGRKRQHQGGHPQNTPSLTKRRGRRYLNDHTFERALATLPHFRLPTETQQKPASKKAFPQQQRRHIALLMISIEDLPHEHLWKAWASEADSANLQVSLLCHAKFPHRVKSTWLQQRMLVDPPVIGRGHEYQAPTYHSRCPDWGSIEITRAMLDLLHEGLLLGGRVSEAKETDYRFSTRRYAFDLNTPEEILSSSPLAPVDKFIFVSETCIPVTTLPEARKALFGDVSFQQHVSWVNARNTPNNGYSKQLQFDKIHPAVPDSCLWKADQWMVLSHAHATAIMQIDRNLPRDHFLWEFFEDTKASDELYFPTALGLLGVLPSAPTINLKRITYADWSVGPRNPASFGDGVEDLRRVTKSAREEGCLLARKFVRSHILPSNVTVDTANDKSEEKPFSGYISVEDWRLVIHARPPVDAEAPPNEAKA